MAKKSAKPKVEILYEYGYCGERVKECDHADDMKCVFDVVKEHPRRRVHRSGGEGA